MFVCGQRVTDDWSLDTGRRNVTNDDGVSDDDDERTDWLIGRQCQCMLRVFAVGGISRLDGERNCILEMKPDRNELLVRVQK